jgi:AhpD family alkylhydroperoxidase
VKTIARPATASGFNKRIFNFSGFVRATDDLVAHLPDLRAAQRRNQVSRAFAERIMLAVTQVNGCRYCSYAHARMALQAGVTPEEIADLMAGQWQNLPEMELVALTFAQHYAETGGRPDSVAWQQLNQIYGAGVARDILAHIRMIMVGNLLGNTFDALLFRLTGRPTAPGSNLWGELGVLLGGIVVVPLLLLKHGVRHLLRPRPSDHAV